MMMFAMHFIRVIPANAGTPSVSATALIAALCYLVLALGRRPSINRHARGYGSWRSPGRPEHNVFWGKNV
jgi:hypothetical protein